MRGPRLIDEFDTSATSRVAQFLRDAHFCVVSTDILVSEAGYPAKKKRPDFLVAGEVTFWGEVKALAPPEWQKTLDRARNYFKQRLADIPAGIDIHVGSAATEADFRYALQVVKQSIKLEKWTDYIILANEYMRGNLHKYSIKSTGSKALNIMAALSSSNVKILPWTLEYPSTSVHDGAPENMPHYDDEFLLEINLRQERSKDGLFLLGPAEGMVESRVAHSFRDDIKDSLRQFRSALSYKELPCALFLVADARTGATPTNFMSAILGDLSYHFSSHETFFGRNGVVRPEHNRNISIYYLVLGSAIYALRNPFARRPMPNVIPSAVEIAVTPGGMIDIPTSTTDN